MKIKALKTYHYAPYSLECGKAAEVPDNIAAKLAEIGFADIVTESAQEAQNTADDKKTISVEKNAGKPTQKRTGAKK